MPELTRAWNMLEEWFAAHEDARAISPASVAQFSKRRGPITWEDGLLLFQALEVLADQGLLRRLFAVQAPSGQLLHPYYDSRSSIPKRVRGQAEEWLDTKEAEIKPIFVGAAQNE
jgi:hypothetical protein